MSNKHNKNENIENQNIKTLQQQNNDELEIRILDIK